MTSLRRRSQQRAHNKVSSLEIHTCDDNRKEVAFRRKSLAFGLKNVQLRKETIETVETIETIETTRPIIFSSPSAKTRDIVRSLDQNQKAVALATAQSFIDCIKGSENIFLELDEFFEAYSIHEQARPFLIEAARILEKPLKMARLGLFFRLSVSLSLTYLDMLTDIVMTLRFYATNFLAFKVQVSLLSTSLGIQGLLMYIETRGMGLKKCSTSVLLALIGLSPCVHSFQYLSGNNKEKGATKTPKQLLGQSRVVELVFESLPGSIFQLYVLFSSQNSEFDLVSVFSIASSICATAFVITDTSIGFERGLMNDQIRGRASDRIFGLLPDRNLHDVLFQCGMGLFIAGYISTSIIAITTAALVVESHIVPIYALCELTLSNIVLRASGKGKWVLSNGGFGLLDVLRPEFICMNFVPILIFRNPFMLGGSLFAMWIVTRLSVNAFAMFYLFNFFVDKNLQSAKFFEDANTIFGVALACAMAGIATILANCRNSHRHTLYRFTYTSEEYVGRYFESDNDPLEYTFDNLSEAKMHWICQPHPFYHRNRIPKIEEWVLSLDTENDLFYELNGVMPYGADNVSGQPWGVVFDLIRKKFEHFGDMRALGKVSTHLETLLVELEELQRLKKLELANNTTSTDES